MRKEKYKIKKGHKGDQWFVMLNTDDSTIVRVFYTRSAAENWIELVT